MKKILSVPITVDLDDIKVKLFQLPPRLAIVKTSGPRCSPRRTKIIAVAAALIILIVVLAAVLSAKRKN